MCGIAGIYRFDGKAVARSLLEGMCDALKHRGPDGAGTFCTSTIGLAHRRLKIIDLSDDANQPMADKEHGLVVVYNGEIYNYLELKQELQDEGFRFRTASDTEVLLKAYAAWDIDCLQRFNGMFAFALWDSKNQHLFCARDRFGVKPFYYYSDGKQLSFASEIKALLIIPEIPVKPNTSVIRDYLTLGIVDHTDETFFSEILKLPAAHYLIANRSGVHIKRYWGFQVSDHLKNADFSPGETSDFRELLKNAVQLRLRSDVPIGSCLSGGIDSTSIVCLINSLIPPQSKGLVGDYQKTYSSVYPISSLDERPYIREVISSTKAEAKWVEPKAEGFLDELDSLLWHQEEPFCSSSIYAQWCVFRKVKETGVKVVLDGQGADEQLCGYRKFYYFFLRELKKRNLLGRLFREGLLSLKNMSYFRGVDLKHSLRYFHLGRHWTSLSSLIKPELLCSRSATSAIGYSGSLARRIQLDMTRFSLPSLLRYEDKNSMAFSIESRTPYLDFRLVEYVAGLPLDSKISRGWTKYILRLAMKGLIPETIRCRRDKLAFDTPQEQWLRNEWRPSVERAFQEDSLLRECIDQEKLLQEYRNFLLRKSRLSHNSFFRAFIFQKWAERFSLSSL